jgi:hypothetical protein
MVDAVKEVLKVNIHYPFVAFTDEYCCLPDCLMCVSVVSKPEAIFAEMWSVVATYLLWDDLLCEPVFGCRDAQYHFASCSFRYFYPAYRPYHAIAFLKEDS